MKQNIATPMFILGFLAFSLFPKEILLAAPAGQKQQPAGQKQGQNCSDSDGGLNYFRQGRAQLRRERRTQEDRCTGNTLTEYFCQNDQIASRNQVCEHACFAGACQQRPAARAPCRNNNQCGGRQRCIEGKCFREISACQRIEAAGNYILTQDILIDETADFAVSVDLPADAYGGFAYPARQQQSCIYIYNTRDVVFDCDRHVINIQLPGVVSPVVLIQAMQNVVVKNCKINAGAILATSTQNATIQNNTIRNDRSSSITVTQSKEVVINNNRLLGGYPGIALSNFSPSAGNPPYHITIRDNLILNARPGISISGEERGADFQLLIENNEICNPTRTAHDIACQNFRGEISGQNNRFNFFQNDKCSTQWPRSANYRRCP